MNTTTTPPPGFLRTVQIILAAKRKQSNGRRERNQQLLNNRSAGKATDWGALGFLAFVAFMLFLNGAAAVCVQNAVKAAQRLDAEKHGKIVVSTSFHAFAATNDRIGVYGIDTTEFAEEAKKTAEQYGGSKDAIERKLRRAVEACGASCLERDEEVAPGVSGLATSSSLAGLFGSLLLLWWAIMLSFQGEGADMDVQRRRHPMWEWLFSHPVPPGAVFLAEMLSPIAANPVFWGGPLFVGILYGFTYDFGFGVLAAVLIGVPVTIAAACAGKAIEIAVLLRCSPRSRGAILGIMAWLGFISTMLFMLGAFYVPRIVYAAAGLLSPLAHLPWPWLGVFVGAWPGASPSFLAGLLACWMAALLATGCSVAFSVWATERGLAGNFSSAVDSSTRASRPARFGREPLYRKEFLWFARDRSAIVQTLLIPVSLAAVQVFNLRGILAHAQGAWNSLSGVAILFGTYFLWILGPKSLQSEGSALWIALTWPRGLESLLKAKAWLWAVISTGLVALVLAYAAYMFPHDIWKIALVGVGWYFFGRSMAEKSVTLVTITSESGETEQIPRGRRWAAQLGMLTFSIGVVTGQWQLAIVGIVFSWITAAAMWQNFRARLPFLYDPWSETLPPAPTLMHAMISVSILLEVSALLSVPMMFLVGHENLAAGQSLGYAVAAVIVSVAVARFLSDRDVRPQDVWCWSVDGERIEECEPGLRRYGLQGKGAALALGAGLAAGLALGIFGHFYQDFIAWLPITAELVRKGRQQMDAIPGFRIWFGIAAVGFAPFAEEYLFRGLLFRALDREWGGWRAILGSAAFFAIYHPPLAWIPVGLLGALNAILYKRTGRLAPAVLLHMTYNAVVLFS